MKKLSLKNAPSSFAEWAKSPACLWPAANYPRGVLKHFDVEDCLNALKCEVRIEAPWGPLMRG